MFPYYDANKVSLVCSYSALESLLAGHDTTPTPQAATATTLMQLLIRAAPNLYVATFFVIRLVLVIHVTLGWNQEQAVRFIMFAEREHITLTSASEPSAEVLNFGKDIFSLSFV